MSAIGSRRWRTNPLRRGIDVLEARLFLLLCALVLVCASAIGVAQGWSALDQGRSVAAEQRADRHPVRAVVLRDAARSGPWADESGRSERVSVPVRWTSSPGGDSTRGNALVAPGTKRGESTKIWLDSQGRHTSAPLRDSDLWADALLEGGGGAAVTIGVGVLTGLGIRVVCNRRRAAGWETEWSRVEPQWSRRD
uniref:Integral membrane protein n=1 Tax=Streptomyces sp. NBC_01401 TaxID=2903854 RepID=A0AAU3GKM3_9ACTN